MNPSTIKPSRTRMLVRHITSEDRSDGGIYLPENAHATHCKSQVIALGRNVSSIFKGATVLTPNYKAPDFVCEGERYIFIKEDDVLAIMPADAQIRVFPLA
jgi:chaperonin GroES